MSQSNTLYIILRVSPESVQKAALKAIKKVDALPAGQYVENVLISEVDNEIDFDYRQEVVHQPYTEKETRAQLDENLRKIFEFIFRHTSERVQKGQSWGLSSTVMSRTESGSWSVLGTEVLLPYLYTVGPVEPLTAKKALSMVKALPIQSWEREWEARQRMLRYHGIVLFSR